jgi:aminoglycoside/choline kinase family phosphotransferase
MNERDLQRGQWLESSLGGRAARVEPASDDASFRRYFRVYANGTTRILMDAPPPQENCRDFVAVTALLQRAGINVPEVIAADLDRGFLLLTDLGDRLFLPALDDSSADALYGDALDCLVQMQARADASSLPAYDERRLREEMELFPEWFLCRHLGLAPGAAALDVLARSFGFLIGECLAQPRVFVHRDYHSRNLMVTAERNPGVLDYQDAVRGPLTYDLVSLLRDVYVAWPAVRVEGWLDGYRQRAARAGVIEDTDPATLRRWFDLSGLQRHLKVAGIFARLFHRDGKARYLADVPLTLHYLRSVASRYPELRALCSLLTELDVTARHLAACESLGLRGHGV